MEGSQTTRDRGRPKLIIKLKIYLEINELRCMYKTLSRHLIHVADQLSIRANNTIRSSVFLGFCLKRIVKAAHASSLCVFLRSISS
jgi:hypothetical protein